MSGNMAPIRRPLSARPIVLAVLDLLVPVLALCGSASAQTPTGSLRGVVEDASGGRLASAKVSAQEVGSAVVRTTQCDDHGAFRLDQLPPGVYHVVVAAPNFSPAISNVTVVVSGVQ